MNSVPEIGLPDFLVPAAIVAVVFLLTRASTIQTWNTSLFQFALIFVLGTASFIVPFVIRTGDAAQLGVEDGVSAGAEWVVFLLLVRRVGNYRAGSLVANRLGLIVLLWVLETPIFVLLSEIYSSGATADISPFAQLPAGMGTAFRSLARYPYNLLNLLDAVTFVLVASLLGVVRTDAALTNSKRFWVSAHLGVIRGYQDMEMSPAMSHTTRLLCASAFLAGNQYRAKVLEFLGDPNRAIAPEVGTDLRLVAQVTKFAAEREQKFQWYFFATACVAFLGALIEPVIGVALLILGGTTVAIAKAWPERFTFTRLFAKHVYDPETVARQFSAELKADETAGLPVEDQNLVVYQGFSPFVGAGTSLGGWSFVVNVAKGKEELGNKLEPRKFATGELYDDIARSIETLRLNGLSQRDMYFANGSDIRDDRTILPDSHSRPVQRIDDELGGQYRNENDPHIRHYKWIRVMDWGNELTTSYFLRCSLRGSHLFVEINRFLLTPIDSSYRAVDVMSENNLQRRVGTVALCLVTGPIYTLLSHLPLIGSLQELLGLKSNREKKQRRKLIDENPQFNYGVARSFRDATSSDKFMHYFQKLDGDFYSKVLEQEILATITNFLDDRNIDISELKERQATILNSGIIIHSGEVRAESLAVGTGAQSTKVSKPEPLKKTRFQRASEQTS